MKFQTVSEVTIPVFWRYCLTTTALSSTWSNAPIHPSLHLRALTSPSLCVPTGVMAAQGLLNNPALFTGAETTPVSCVRDWVRLATDAGTPFTCMHHHLIYMLERLLPRTLRRTFNVLPSHAAVLEFLRDQLALDV